MLGYLGQLAMFCVALSCRTETTYMLPTNHSSKLLTLLASGGQRALQKQEILAYIKPSHGGKITKVDAKIKYSQNVCVRCTVLQLSASCFQTPLHQWFSEYEISF